MPMNFSAIGGSGGGGGGPARHHRLGRLRRPGRRRRRRRRRLRLEPEQIPLAPARASAARAFSASRCTSGGPGAAPPPAARRAARGCSARLDVGAGAADVPGHMLHDHDDQDDDQDAEHDLPAALSCHWLASAVVGGQLDASACSGLAGSLCASVDVVDDHERRARFELVDELAEALVVALPARCGPCSRPSRAFFSSLPTSNAAIDQPDVALPRQRRQRRVGQAARPTADRPAAPCRRTSRAPARRATCRRRARARRPARARPPAATASRPRRDRPRRPT